MLNENSKVADAIHAGAIMNTPFKEQIGVPSLTYDLVCTGPLAADRQRYFDIQEAIQRAISVNAFALAEELSVEAASLCVEKWRESIHNLVTTEGKNDIINNEFKGSSYTAAWYLGLKGTGSASASDTLASHGGWTEQTPYSGNRPAITWGSTSAGSNTASAVSIAITGSATVAGAFIASVNTGSSGILYSAGDFASSRTVANGDTLNVTPTVSVS